MRDTSSVNDDTLDADLLVVDADIMTLQRLMEQKALSSQSLVHAYLRRIAAYDQQGPALNAIAALHPDALSQARRLDEERARGHVRGPLHGIPLLVKDNYHVDGLPTTAGTLALASWEPKLEATVVQRLRAAGAVILGKTTLHELASGITNISSLTGQTRNPYAPHRVPGGSSGGTAAAMAASFAAAGLGSDTSGSIRIPAAVNNLVGLRLTAGLISRAGIVPLSTTQDVPGPLTRSVEDLTLVLDAMVGPDTLDPTTAGASRHIPPSYHKTLEPNAIAGLRIGIVDALFGTQADEEEISSIALSALACMEVLGARMTSVKLPRLATSLREYSLIPFEFREAFAEYLRAQGNAPIQGLSDILHQGLHHEQLDKVLQLRANQHDDNGHGYATAMQARQRLHRAMHACMNRHQVDMLVYPVLRGRPVIAGEFPSTSNSQLSATTGMPALSLPIGFTRDGLPVGLELLGRDYTESHLLNCAWHWERAMRPRRTPFTTPPLRRGRTPPVWRDTLRLNTEAQGYAQVHYEVDLPAAALRFEARAEIKTDDAIIALTLHAPPSEYAIRGPVIAHLLRGQTRASGTLALRADLVSALKASGLIVRLYTRRFPLGSAEGVLMLSTPPED